MCQNGKIRGTLKSKIDSHLQTAEREGYKPKGRQLMKIIYKRFEFNSRGEGLYQLSDLIAVELRTKSGRRETATTHDLELFIDEWTNVLIQMKKQPEEETIHTLFLDKVGKVE
jgi:hypothetical protein